jgi:hypothetical protein
MKEEKITHTEPELNDTELQFVPGGVLGNIPLRVKQATALVGIGGGAYLLSKNGPKPPETPGGVDKPTMSEDTIKVLTEIAHK